MPRGSPISFSFHSFRGATRRLVLLNALCFFIFALGAWVAPRPLARLLGHLVLQPAALLHGEVWQLVTYSFVNTGLLNTLFALMTLWFAGTMLESTFSSRWVIELYLASVIGGGILASALSFAHLPMLSPFSLAAGAWSGTFGLMVALAVFFGDQEALFMFILRMKIKYMVILFLLFVLATGLTGGDAFNALVQLAAAGCGYLYVRKAPRRGLAFGLSESYYGIRNSYYRWKRRRAAKKFTVYMRGQNREVHFDADGRFIEPDEKRDPNDKRWMN